MTLATEPRQGIQRAGGGTLRAHGLITRANIRAIGVLALYGTS